MKVREIRITRAEGPSALCDIPHTSTSFKDASAWLWRESETFPILGYDKHDFTIVFEDGFEYAGTLGCKHHSKPEPDLDVLLHVKEFAEFYAGRLTNPWCGMDDYRQILEFSGDDHVKASGEFIDNYLSKLEPEGVC